jgi:DNA-binding Xre family transcriptional regulator
MNVCSGTQGPLAVNDRQLATILAALRFHQAENLQGGAGIADRAIEEIATDTGKLTALDFDEVESLCRTLNTITKTSQTF